ncbi:MAG: SDR family oxidoreductase [Propionibacteriaceae bacterium]|nr:SDR family oxidoreductase [Propionibacteriaceae bacterium]
MTAKLSGQVALITGSSGGIGRASVLALAAEGAAVLGVSRSLEGSDILAREAAGLGGKYIHVTGDARDAKVAQAAAAQTLEAFGQIDILVNNAGVGHYDDFVNASEELYDEIMDTSMRTTFLFTQQVVPHMIGRRKGLIIQIASQAGIQGFPRESVYCAAKHAQVGFSRALRRELQPHGIKVSAICPAAVKTNFAYNRGRDDEFYSHDDYFLRAEDVADVVCFLATGHPGARLPEISMMSVGEAL